QASNHSSKNENCEISGTSTRGFWRRGTLSRSLFGLADHGRDGLQSVLFVEIDQFNALSVSASLANVFDCRAHHLSAHGDEQNLLFLLNGERADDSPGPLIGLH